ncbi:MAG: MFS transporter [bacterium]|nr:MFS transporter [bacterium]
MVNRVIRHLVMSDFMLFFSVGMIAPIFAIFILKAIPGSSLRVIGLSAAFYWIARTLSTVPLSRFMDKTDGERDEFYFMVIGSFIFSSIPLFYLFINQAWHLYLIQFIGGLANSMAVPAWRILFTDHLDRGKTGYEWSLEDIGVGTATALSAYLGSIVAERFGFEMVFVLLAILGYAGTMILIPIYHEAKTLAQIKRANRLEAILEKRKNLAPVKIEERN